jgi:hypothetical protein
MAFAKCIGAMPTGMPTASAKPVTRVRPGWATNILSPSFTSSQENPI